MNDNNEWLWAQEEIVFAFSRQLLDPGLSCRPGFFKKKIKTKSNNNPLKFWL